MSVVSIPPSPVVSTLRGWKEKQTTSPIGRPIFCQAPSISISEPMPQAASSTTGTPSPLAISQDRGDVAGKAHLVNAENGRGAPRHRRGDVTRIDIVAVGLDIDENGRGAALADGIGAGYETVADGDHLAAGADADRQERQMQRRGAVRNRAGVSGAGQIGEGRFEPRHLRTLRDPAGQDGGARRLGLGLTQKGVWRLGSFSGLRHPGAGALALPPVDQFAQALAGRDSRAETEFARGGGATGQPPRHRVH